MLILGQSRLSLQAVAHRNVLFNTELSLGVANAPALVFLAASLEAHYAQPAHCSCSTLHSLGSHKGSWTSHCHHGEQHPAGSDNSCGNNQWTTGLFLLFQLAARSDQC